MSHHLSYFHCLTISVISNVSSSHWFSMSLYLVDFQDKPLDKPIRIFRGFLLSFRCFLISVIFSVSLSEWFSGSPYLSHCLCLLISLISDVSFSQWLSKSPHLLVMRIFNVLYPNWYSFCLNLYCSLCLILYLPFSMSQFCFKLWFSMSLSVTS